MFGELFKIAMAPVRIAAAVAVPVVAIPVAAVQTVLKPVAEVAEDVTKSVEDAFKL